ncbi:MAG: MFS transporter [Gemmataceae bacterium]|nr:MFS transporter [Gemmataceae bacterium]
MRYLVLFFLCLVAVIAYVQRVGINSAFEPIQSEFRIDTQTFGVLGFAFLIGYAVLQVPSGWLADRWGSRNALALYACLWSLCAALASQTRDFDTLLIVWTAMGLAQAGVFPSAAKAIGAWFPDTQKAMASGLLGASTMLGTAAASMITSSLLVRADWSWQLIYVVYGAAGVAWAIVFCLLIPEHGGSMSSRAPAMTRGDWGRMFASVPMWLICGQQFFRAAAMIFFINWFPKFLTESRHLPLETAALVTMWANGGAMVGGICGGFFSDWLLRKTGWRRASRQGIAVAGLSIAACVVALTYVVTDIEIATALFTIGAFTASFGGVSGYTVTIEYGGRRIGTVFSMMNMCGNFGAALSSYAAGAVVQRTGSWDFALFMFAAIFVVDAVCWALLNPQGTLFDDAKPAAGA